MTTTRRDTMSGGDDDGGELATLTTNSNITIKTVRRRHNMTQVASSVPEALKMLMKHVAPVAAPPPLHQLSAMISNRARQKDKHGMRAEHSRQDLFKRHGSRLSRLSMTGGDVLSNVGKERALSAIAQAQPEAVLDHNKFRASRIYDHSVSETLKKWKPLLQGIFNYYKSRMPGKRMHVDQFCTFCEDSGLTSKKTGLSRREVRLAFVFSQMEVVDDVVKHYEAVTASFLDFCEAFCRLVDGMCPPSEAQLREFFTHDYKRFNMDDLDESYAYDNPHLAYYFIVPESEIIGTMTPWHGSIIETPEEAAVEEAEEMGLPNPLALSAVSASTAGSSAVQPKWEWRRRPLQEMIPDAMKVVTEYLCKRFLQQSTTEMEGDEWDVVKALTLQLNRETKGLTVGIFD